MRHTPGPWWVDGYRVRHDKEANPNHRRGPAVCDCAMTHGLGDAALEDTANAHLIAASPDLLEALKQLQPESTGCMESMDWRLYWDAVKVARSAIAKAEGR